MPVDCLPSFPMDHAVLILTLELKAYLQWYLLSLGIEHTQKVQAQIPTKQHSHGIGSHTRQTSMCMVYENQVPIMVHDRMIYQSYSAIFLN